MSHRNNNLTAPATTKRATEDEIPISTSTATTTSLTKRRKVETAAIVSGSSPLKPEPKTETQHKVDLQRYGVSSSGCSEEESSDDGRIKPADSTNGCFIKKSSDHNNNGNISVVSSPESEVCVEKEEIMESKTALNTNTRGGRSIVFEAPSDKEIEEFFLAAEKVQAQRFKEKYNFDIVNDVPVQGRFEWSPVKH